ncbi:MAG TPA: OB-fold domain-containing protein, partial [Nocardioides sp.]|nr:OB-fold domain-containing protein [Nocardioides sp.]
GLQQQRSADSPRSRALDLLEAAGFTSVVAVNSELELKRYLRPDEWPSNVEVLDAVSEEKATGLGVGHFVTTRHRYTTAHGDHVGDLLFRVLKFKPGTGKAPSAIDGGDSSGSAPNPDPALRPRPGVNRDNEFFWDGARKHELRIQQCAACKELHNPPTPRCWYCGGFDMGWIVSAGKGRLYSFAVPHFPQANGFRYPVLVGLVELAEGVRLVSNIVGVMKDQLRVGMELELMWLDSHPAQVDGATDARGPISLPQFRPATPARRKETLHASAVGAGDPLPLFAVPLTPTLIVAGALATRDYQEVHHDRDLAVARGSKDIFMNINTTLGLVQRYVTDWAGPEALVRALRVRLGAPNYPGDIMTFSGSVQSADQATGEMTVALQGVNSLGAHATGTVELVLPGGSSYSEEKA